MASIVRVVLLACTTAIERSRDCCIAGCYFEHEAFKVFMCEINDNPYGIISSIALNMRVRYVTSLLTKYSGAEINVN